MNNPLQHRTPFFDRKPGRILGSAAAGFPAVCIIAVALIVWPLTELEWLKARVIEVSAAIMLLCWAAVKIRAVRKGRGWIDRPIFQPVAPILWSLGLLACTWYIATLYSLAPESSILGGPTRGHGVLLFLALAVFFLAHCAVRIDDLRVFWGVVVSGTLVAAGAVLQLLGLDGGISYSQSAIGSTLGNQSFVRDYLAVCVVLIVSVFAPRVSRLVWLVPAAAFLILTVGYRPASVQYRIHMWSAILPHIWDSPLVGWGPDTGVLIVDHFAHDAVGETDRAQDRTENLELDILVERGIPGLLAELLFWGLVLWRGWRSPYAMPLLACLGLAQFSVMSVPSQLLAWVLAGLAVAWEASSAFGTPTSGFRLTSLRTDVHPSPTCLPISTKLTPSDLSFRHNSAVSSGIFLGEPIRTPRSRAAASPAFVRSEIIWRSS